MSIDRAAFDRRLLESLRQGRVNEAATDAIKTYGPEIYGLLRSIHQRREDTDDVFSLFCEKLWKGLAGFAGRSSVRTWAYAIAWNASSSFRTRQAARREVPVTDSQMSALAQQVRSETLPRMRNEERSELVQIRRTLPPEDQALLVLRVERELDWRDLSRVMNPHLALDEGSLTRESARLRKRYQAVKERLRTLIRAQSSEG